MILVLTMHYLAILGVVVLGFMWPLIHGLRCLKVTNKKLPPGPFSLPLIGNLYNIILATAPLHQSLLGLAHKYGPIMSLRLGLKTTVVISSSAVAKEAFKNHDLALSDKTFKASMEAYNHHQFSISYLPFASTRRQNLRKLLYSFIISGNKLDTNRDLRYRKIQELIAYCHQCSQTGEAVDIGLASSDTAVNILSNAIFSMDLVDLCADSVKKFKNAVRYITYLIGKLDIVDYFPVLKNIDPQGLNRRMSASFDKIFRIFGGFVDERLGQRQQRNKSERSNDLLDVLLNMSQEDANAMDRNQIHHLFLDLFVAGTDSSSALVEWAMLEVMKNPDVLRKSKAELAEVIGKGKMIEEADIARLPYLQCILKETLRIHPPIPLLTRKAEQDVKVSGYIVPKGSQVLVNVWSTGRDPATWEDPLT